MNREAQLARTHAAVHRALMAQAKMVGRTLVAAIAAASPPPTPPSVPPPAATPAPASPRRAPAGRSRPIAVRAASEAPDSEPSNPEERHPLVAHLHADPVSIDAALARGGLGRPSHMPLGEWLDLLAAEA